MTEKGTREQGERQSAEAALVAQGGTRLLHVLPPSLHSFIQSLKKNLWNAYCVLVTVLGAGSTLGHIAHIVPALREPPVLDARQALKKCIISNCCKCCGAKEQCARRVNHNQGI